MPRKINKRKKLQAERKKAEQAAKPKPCRVGMIAHHHTISGGSTHPAILTGNRCLCARTLLGNTPAIPT